MTKYRSPIAHRLLLSLLSGVLLSLCFPRVDLGWLAWVALAPLFLVVRVSRPGAAALCGYVMGLAFFWLHIGWLSIFGWYVGVAATLFQAMWPALFGAVAALVVRRSPPCLIPAALAAAWTAVDWARTLGPLGFAWGTVSLSQHRTLPVLQVVDLIGPWGLTALIALVNAAVTEPLHARLRDRAGERLPAARRWGWPAAAGGLVVLAAIRGALLLAGAPPVADGGGLPQRTQRMPERDVKLLSASAASSAVMSETTGSIVVAVLQGSVDQDVVWDRRYVAATMECYGRLTREAAERGATLIVWPETSLPGELRYEPELRREVGALARETGAWLVIGSNDHDEREVDRELNQAFLVSPSGEVAGSYAKVRLVPFGEFVPMRALFPFLEQLHVRPFNLSPGPGFIPLRAGAHSLGALICFESSFPEVSRALVREGAALLVELTNDTWFGRTPAAAQHAAMGALRAVETRRGFARAVTTGISQLIDPYGRVLGSVGLFENGLLVAPMALGSGETPYVRWGDWAAYASALLAAVLLLRRAERV
jgi:apolipoprotein N-acyltransferase